MIVAYLPKLYIRIYYHYVIITRKNEYQSHHAQNRLSGDMTCRVFETYNNYMIPHVRPIYPIASVMDMDTMFTYPLYQHALPHWKCVLSCCENFCVFISQVRNQIITTQRHFPQYVFMYIKWSFDVQSMANTHLTKRLCCVLPCKKLHQVQNYTQENIL